MSEYRGDSGIPHVFVVDGERVRSITAAFRRAVELGFDGSLETIRYRLRMGVSTWSKLAAPPSYKGEQTTSVGHKRRQFEKRLEVDSAIVALDARKAEIARKQKGEEG